MKEEYVIIGGGVAGLCAAIRLTELGISPLIIEGGSYPAHKVCGEFLSPECLPILHKWDIYPVSISHMHLRTPSQTLIFSFPQAAGSLSHLQLDPLLAKHAQINGAKLRTHTQVKALLPKHAANEWHKIELNSGEILLARTLIIATGRIPNYQHTMPHFSYMGIKAHFKNIPLHQTLEMFSFPGAYMGISPVENQHYNVACLARIEQVKKYENIDLFIQSLMSKNAQLQTYLSEGINLFSDWMTTSIPNFGIKPTPLWKDSYFIGDASLTIPPACGDGLSLAILGGCMAAEHAIQKQDREFKRKWQKYSSSLIFWAKLLHYLMLHPSVSNPLLKISKVFPFFSKSIFHLTRHHH